MPRNHKRSNACSHQIDFLQHACHNLDRLVSIGESLLDAVTQQSASSDIAPTKKSRGSQSKHVQRRCESDTNNCVLGSSLVDEDLITFVEAAKMIPRPKPPNRATISRWASVGVRGIKLESIYVGGRKVTSKQAVERFLQAGYKNGFRGFESRFEMMEAMKKRMQQ